MIFSFHIVTHSYSSCLSLCALDGTMVLFVSKLITFYELVQLLYEVMVLNYLVEVGQYFMTSVSS